MYADPRALVTPPPQAERGVRLRWREPADLDVAGDADSAIVAARAGLRATLLEALIVGNPERAIQRRRVVPAVIGDSGDRVERERFRRDEVLPAKRGRVRSDLVRKPVDRALHEVRGLGPAGPAIRVNGRGVRVRAAHLVVERGKAIRAGDDEHVEDRRDARRERLQVRADVRDGADAQAEQGAVTHGRELDIRDVIASVDRREVTLAALLGPLHRPAERLRQVADEELLGVDLELAP